MRLKKLLLAAAFGLVVVPSAGVAQDSPVGNPGSVFVLPEGKDTPIASEEDPEITTDIEIFRDMGFTEPDWATHTEQVEDVLKEVVLPDWRHRTGATVDPTLPSIDIAVANITGGDYNDLLVMSRLPEDCGPTGCLFQLYSFVNEVWVKRFEFKTVAFAWKQGEERDDATVIAQVGGMWIPSKTHLWKEGQLR